MKERKLFMLIIALIFFIPQSKANFQFVIFKDIAESSLLKQLPLKSERLLHSIILLPKEKFDEEEALKMIKRIDQLPNSLVEKLKNHHIYVKLFTGSLTDQKSASSLKGLTPRGYANMTTTWDDVPGSGGGRIVLAKIGASEKGSGHGSVNLELHELAHSIDKIVFNHIREDEAFLAIWREEVGNLFTVMYFHIYPEEYFAETFAMFYANPDTNQRLKSYAPKTYVFINNIK